MRTRGWESAPKGKKEHMVLAGPDPGSGHLAQTALPPDPANLILRKALGGVGGSPETRLGKKEWLKIVQI